MYLFANNSPGLHLLEYTLSIIVVCYFNGGITWKNTHPETKEKIYRALRCFNNLTTLNFKSSDVSSSTE